MRNESTAIIERDGDLFIACSPEVPGANGPGHSKEEVRQSLAEAIALILHDRARMPFEAFLMTLERKQSS